MEPTKEGLKRCARGEDCIHPDGPDLPRSEFNVNRARKDGLETRCRACYNEYYRAYTGRRKGLDGYAPDDDPPDGSIIPATLRRLNGDGQVPAPSSNGAHPWGPIREVADAPGRRVDNTTHWVALYGELLLRLEQTPPPKALEVPFPDKKTAASAKGALRNRLRREGRAGVMSIAQRGVKLYVRRGPNWSK